MNCPVCHLTATNTCARCPTKYCSRDCQLAHWPIHKSECNGVTQRYAKFLEYATLKILGNIKIIAAWNGPGTIEITISETILEFIKPGSFHFACLNWIQDGETTQIRYVLNDYTHTQPFDQLSAEINNIIKKKHPKPDSDWSVMFNL
jgi:hypothetical protein